MPTASQFRWQDMEFYLFVHFGPNTFTDLEWGRGTEKEEVFNPGKLDCRQWVAIAKATGARGIIITAKHHDGFCLWPSAYSRHTVRESVWRNGQGDVLKELATACKEAGLPLGIYLSPWDRNHPQYGTAGYNQVFISMMKEVISRYGPLFEFWWDGANGEGPNGKKQVYDFKAFEQCMRSMAPQTVVFSDIGPDIRWVGNENGVAGKTNWNLLDTAGYSRGAGAPPTDSLNRGNEYGVNWIPAECDVSIRKGWFYHQTEDGTVKSPEELFNLYLQSVGRGANLLLNVPPNREGLFSPVDSAALAGFKKLRDISFAHPLLSQSGITFSAKQPGADMRLLADGDSQSFVSLGKDYRNNFLEIRLSAETAINCIVLQEPLQMGQRISRFSIRGTSANGIVFETEGTTIGHKRILTFPRQKVTSLRLLVLDAKAEPLISEINAFLIPENLVEKN